MLSMSPISAPLLVTLGLAVWIALSLMVPTRVRLFLALTSALPQVFIVPALGTSLPLALFFALSLWPESLRSVRFHLSAVPSLAVIALVTVSAMSLWWSPNPRQGIKTIAYLVTFLFIVAAARLLERRSPGALFRIMPWVLILGLIEVALVVAFRVSPVVEERFLHSGLAGLLVGPKTSAFLFTSARNNVLDSAKAGGVFVNANVAGAYIGSLAAMFLGLGRALRNRWYTVAALLTMAAIPFTGSKAAVLLDVTLLLAYVTWTHPPATKRMRAAWVAAASGLITMAVTAISAQTVLAPKNGFASRLWTAVSQRVEIWGFVPTAFANHPLAGLGFGGWLAQFPAYAQSHGITFVRDTPASNSLLILWSNSGMIALLLGVLFMISVMKRSWSGTRSLDRFYSGVSFWTAASYGWVLLQSMGTNYGLVGEAHTAPLLAAALGAHYAIRSRLAGKGAK